MKYCGNYKKFITVRPCDKLDVNCLFIIISVFTVFVFISQELTILSALEGYTRSPITPYSGGARGEDRFICDGCYKLLEKATRSEKIAKEARQAFIEKQHEDAYLARKRALTPTHTTPRIVKAPRSASVSRPKIIWHLKFY